MSSPATAPPFRVLGPIGVGTDRALGALAANALLSLILARGHTRATPALIDDIWQDGAPAATRQALQTLLSRLRAAGAGDALQAVPGGYALRVADDDIDLTRATLLAAQAQAALGEQRPEAACAAAAEALALFGEPIGGGASNSDLVAELAQRANQLEAQLQLTRAEAQVAAGQPGEALADVEASGLATSSDDRFVAAHLRALLAAGRYTEALDRFAQHRAWLRRELGASPPGDLVALNAAALKALATTAPPTTAVRLGLPSPTTALVGRDRDIGALRQLIDSSRLVTVTGVGGLGKTRLAYRAAREFDGHVVAVELAGVREGDDVEMVAASTIALLDSAPDPTRASDPLAKMIHALSQAPTLLVMDNCEHVLDAASRLVGTVLAHVPQLTVLTTSRRPLGLAGERIYPLEGLASHTDMGHAGPAVELFAERARAVRPTVVLDVDRVAQLTDRLDGLPLAIELAAARVRSMSVAEIDRRLSDRFSLLTLGDPSAPARHHTLRAVVDWSWDLLTASQARLAQRLSVFPASFDVDGAVAIARPPSDEQLPAAGGARSPSVIDVLDDLDALVGQSLVQAFESTDTGGVRYRMVETIKEYCADRAREAGEEAPARAAMAAWARTFSRRLLVMMVGPAAEGDQPIAVRAEEDALLAAFRRALDEGDAATAAAVFGSLGTWMSLQGALFDLHDLGYPVLELLEANGLPEGFEAEAVLACALLGFVESMTERHHRERIHAVLTTALATDGWIPPAVRFVADLVLAIDDEPRADAIGTAASSSPDPAVRCLSRLLYASLEENAGRVRRAIEVGLEAHASADASGLRWLRAVCAQMLAGFYSEVGDLTSAQAWTGMARRDLALLGQRSANLDITQIEVLGAIHDGNIDRARTLLAGWRDAPEAGRADVALMMEMAEAEIELAASDTDAGLARLARVLDAAPGGRDGVGPWWLIAWATYLAALCRSGQAGGTAAHEVAVRLRRDAMALTTLANDRLRVDHPVAGTVAAALGAWLALTRPQSEEGPQLLALAERLSSRQDVPSLGRELLWSLIDSERRSPAEQGVAALPAEECLARTMAVVDQLEL